MGNFLPRYLELGTGTPYHETESLVDFSRLGKITHTIKNGSLPVKLPVKISPGFSGENLPEIFIVPKVAY